MRHAGKETTEIVLPHHFKFTIGLIDTRDETVSLYSKQGVLKN